MNMAFHAVLLLLVALLALCCEADIPTKPPHYRINLDIAPEDRWKQVVLDFPNTPRDLDIVIRSIVPGSLLPLVELIAASIDSYLPEPYASEIRGFAKYSASSLGEIVMVNIFYEALASCTSIVASDEQGRIWHGRNLDYSFAKILRNNTIEVDFVRNGTVMYSGVTFVGYVGVLSGQRPFAFTISLDQRDTKRKWETILVAILDRNAALIGFVMRNVLESCEDFQSAVKTVSNQDTMTSEYYILGGVSGAEGAVITKGRLNVIDVWYLQPSTGRWFLVETNYDHWKSPPAEDDRRDPAIKAMNVTGRSLTKDKLFNVMSTPKVLNSRTISTTVMSASQPYLVQTWIRHVN